MDHGHELAEESLKALEREYARIYGQAAREMKAKHEKALKKYQGELSQRLKALDDSDPEAVKRHEAWLAEQAMTQQWVGGMSDELSARATHANVLAMDALHDRTPRVYAENANWAAYDIDRKIGYDTTFTLVDEDTVRNLIMNGGSTEAVGSVYKLADGTASTAGGRLLPEITLSLKERMFPHVDETRDYIWNRRRFHTAITQGIIQGESIPNIVKRLEGIFGSNRAAATRAARTATTCAENAGRISSYQRAQDMGIKLKQEWLAALDSRTRSSHRMLDGQKVEIGGKFQAERGELRFPGDPLGHPAEVYNCRCTLVADVDGVDQEDAERWSRLPKGMTYDEWKKQSAARMAGQKTIEPPAAAMPETRYGAFRGLSYVDDNLGSHWGDGSDMDPQRMIMEDTGFDAERAEQVRKDVSSWVGQGYKKIRLEEGDYALTADRLDEFIAASPKYMGTVYRGIGVERGAADEILDTLRNGGSIDNHGIASWATESDWATEFMSMNSEELDDPVGIIFQLDENRSGASIKHIASIDNDEVVAPRGVKYELVGEVETVEDPYDGEYMLIHVREVV